MTAYLLDTETTGTNDDSEIIELAWMMVIPPAWVGGINALLRFQPTRPIQFGALNVHHILPEELCGYPPSSRAKIPQDTSYLIGHNIDFDWKMLGSPSVRRICTLALSRSLWPDTDSHSLGAMLYFLEGANRGIRALLKGSHSAANDIENNLILLQYITKKLSVTTLEDLWEASEVARIPVKMTFGKHKGKLISEVDKGYASWYAKQPDSDPYLLQAFRLAKLLPPERR